MFAEPTKGSIATTYFAYGLVVSIIPSFTSDTIQASCTPFFNALIKRMSAITCNFCWLSPGTFTDPAEPVMSASPDRVISLLIIFAANAMSLSNCVNSPGACGNEF